MVGITVKGRFREMCLLLMLVIIGTRLMCRISLLWKSLHISFPICAGFRECRFVLHKNMDDFYKKAAFLCNFGVFHAFPHKSCVIFFWGLSFLHIWKPRCAIFFRYPKYYTNAGSVRRLVHDAGIQPLSFHDIVLKWSFMSIDKRLVQRYILNIKKRSRWTVAHRMFGSDYSVTL